VRSALRIGAGLGLALVILTCTERSVTGPKPPGIAALDFSAWATHAAGQPPIPVDSLEVTLRRHADGSVAFHQFYGFRADTLKADSAVVRLDVTLTQSTETFDIVVRAFGGGLDWYRFTGSVQLSANATARPLLAGVYVGPGANAVRVKLRPADTTAVGGTTFPLRATAYAADSSAIAGVPIGYRLSDSTRGSIVYPTPSSALFTAAPALRDSVWLVAETPTHLKDSTRVHLVPPAARLVLVSGDKQTSVLNAPLPAPLTVRVLDALNGGFKGDTVRWTVTAGAATLKTPFSVSDDSGLAVMSVTPTAIGPLAVQAAVAGLQGSPVSFGATAIAGTIKQIVISPKIDTIAYRTTVSYTAVARDALGNPVNTTFAWTSTVPTIASVSSTGVATALAGDSTKIIAAAAGVADTARLYVRALRAVTVAPADTVVTAVADSLQLRVAHIDNFGAAVTTGFTTTFTSASPGVVSVGAAGKVKSTGPGNGVVVVRDSVDSLLKVQGSATIRVNQVTRTLYNRPGDSVTVGPAGQITIVQRGTDSALVGAAGQTQILAVALDSNGYKIPAKTFGWASRNPALATVSPTGIVSGVAIGTTYVVDSVDGFRDSTRVAVVAAPPKQIQWAFDSTAVGNGGNVAIAITVTQPPAAAPLTIKITAADSTIAKATPNTVTIAAGASATSAVISGLHTGSTVLTASDASGLGYASRSMTVGVVSTITFREIAYPCCQQQYFYLNQKETHKAQVWLSDPAPAGGLGITFLYGKGLASVSPSPAIIQAGQLSADVTFLGLTPGAGGQPDSVVPSSGGYVGKFSYVYVGPDSLRLTLPYPYNGVLGVGQTMQPYVSFQWPMDHPLLFTAGLSPAIGTAQTPDTIRTGATSQYFTVKATGPGATTLTVSAPGWTSATGALTFTTPYLGASGSSSMVAGDPTKGYWGATAEDSLRYGHAVADTVALTAVSHNPNAVAVDSPTVRIPPGSTAAMSYGSLRALPTAGGDSAWILVTAPGYRTDSFQVHVTKPVLTLALGYPYDGRVGRGTYSQNAGYVAIPYVRPDTFWVVFAHSRKGVAGGPDSVAILKGQTSAYFNIRGDTLGADTMSVSRATGYVVSGSPVVLTVDPLHVHANSYPSAMYTISRPQLVSAYVTDSVNGVGRPLLKPLLVSLVSTNTRTFTLDSAQVAIDSGTYVSHYDTLRVALRADTTAGAYVRFTTAASSPDSTPLLKVQPTPLTLNVPYPYNGQVGRGLKLQGFTASIPDQAPDTVRIAVKRYVPLRDSLSADTVKIAKAASSSQPFDVFGFDSTGSDSVTAAATGFVTARTTITAVPAALTTARVGASHLTTEPSATVYVYARTRAGYQQTPSSTLTFSVKSTDSTVIRIDSGGVLLRGDSATSTIAAGQSYGYYRIHYFGGGTARVIVSATGFDRDSTELVTVTGPSLYFGTGTVTVGTGQIFAGQYVYVNNAVNGSPLVIHLSRTDSAASVSAQVFGLSADSVTIPVGSSSSGAFDITGKNAPSANLIARANGYNQATAIVSVGQPRLIASQKTLSLFVGAPATSVAVYPQDHTGSNRIVATPTAVGDTVSAPGIVATDSAVKTIAARGSSTSFALSGLKKGSAAVIYSSTAFGYRPDTTVVSVDTATLVVNAPPAGLGPNQQAQMYVSIPFSAAAPVTVNLASSAPGTLTVPGTVTIPGNSNYVYFNVTGVAIGTATISATASGFYPAAPVGVTIGPPKLGFGFSSSVSAGVPATIYVYPQDQTGTTRNITAPLTITLSSSSPNHTAFGATSLTIPAGQSSASTTVTFDTAGTYTINASASGYTGASVVSTATGALVTMVAGNAFSPANVTISAGQYVTWKNADAITHTTTENSVTPVWNTSLLPGQTYSQYFGTAGTFSYHCTIHAAVMSGTVTVK
jgi:plastocyanin